MDNSKNFFGTVMLGLAVGVAIGILIAPDKGSETRKRLFNGAQDLAEDLKDKIKEGTDRFNDLKGIAQDKIEELRENAKSMREQASKSIA